MLELIAAGCVGAVASAAVTVVAMRHNLASTRAELSAVEAEQDHRDQLQDSRYEDLLDAADELAIERDRLAQWDDYFRTLYAQTAHPDDNGPEDVEDNEPVADEPTPIRSRFSYQPDAAEKIMIAEGIPDIFAVVMAEGGHGHNYGDEPLPVLAEASAAVFRRMARTGQFPIVGHSPSDPVGPSDPPGPPTPQRLTQVDGPDPVRVDAARRMHRAISTSRPGDSRPDPDPGTAKPTKHAVAR